MASDLKRVGLVFDTEGHANFIKSLQLVNATASENYALFKNLQSQYDQNTTTAQKLKDKLEYLNNAYDIQKDKVTILSKELEELTNDENASEVAIQKKKVALANAETYLNKYQKQIDETTTKLKLGTSGLEDFSKKLDGVSDKLVNAGKKMSVYSAAYASAMGLSLKSSINFESAFAGVEKTVDGTTEELEKIKLEIRDMAKEMPASAVEISAVAEAAGQLGIKTNDITSFTEVMINLGEATNLSSEEAATSLAKFANITNMSSENYGRLGSTIVALGNNFATTEADIVAMAQNLASAGSQVGMTESDILALAASLSSVGLEASAGGTAFSKALIQMQLAVETNSKDLKNWADVAGMSTQEFSKLFKEDATSALQAFITGLGNCDESSQSAIKVLDDMGITETRLRDSLLRSANASELFTDAINLGSKAWEENSALNTEVEKRYSTTESKMKIMKNTLNDLAITIGDMLLPFLQKMLDSLKGVINWINNLSPGTKKLIVVISGLVAVIGPLLILIGKVASGVSGIIKLLVALKPIFVALKASIVAFSGTLGLPVIAIAAIGAAIVALVVLISKHWNQILEFTKNLFNEIKSIFEKFDEWLGNIFTTDWTEKFGALGNILNSFLSNVENIYEGIKNIFKGLIDFISGIFSGDWSRAWNGVVNIFKGIFETLEGIAKIPLNGIIGFLNIVIDGINYLIRGLNKISFEAPDWLKYVGLGNVAGQKIGFNISEIGKIQYLAKGGELLNGMAVVAEAGPEMLIQNGNNTKVLPLSDSSTTKKVNMVDYNKMFNVFLKALNSCKMMLDKDGFIRLVDDYMNEVI